MKKILFVFGTRPEAIKMAPVILTLKNNPAEFAVSVCVTAQHREMLDTVLEWFQIKPDYDLDLMKPGQDLYTITAEVLLQLKRIYEEVKPDVVLVQGDTTTCMAASMAAFYQRITVGHIEAGLRTWDIYSPFPEEFNRKVTTSVARYHFAPTSMSARNLYKENVPKNHVHVTGNTVIDALMFSVNKIRETDRKYYALKEVDISKKIVLITAHRRESFGQGFTNICAAVKKLASAYRDIEFVYPVHPNPNVRQPVQDSLSGIKNVKLIQPLNYEEIVYLMDKSYLILTDSGGIQEEAPSLGKPVLVLRDKTERPEAVKAGTVKLVGTDVKKIVTQTTKLLDDKKAYARMSKSHNPYGDGKASERIEGILGGL